MPTDISSTITYKEIHEQPRTVSGILLDERPVVERLASEIKQRGIRQVFLTARGTSDNAARYAKYLFGAVNRMVVSLAAPSLFTIYKRPPDLTGTLVLGISQSGSGPDINAVLKEGKKQGALTAAITNNPQSEITQYADHVIDTRAGEEKAVAATKTYTGQLTAIALLSALLAEDPYMFVELEQLPGAVTAALATRQSAAKAAEMYTDIKHCAVIGRGYNYATAFELALKLKELTYTLAEPYSSADFIHGPMALVEPGFPVVVINPAGEMTSEIDAFLHRVEDLGARLVLISDHDTPGIKVECKFELPQLVPEWLSPVTTIIPGQLFAAYLAAARGVELDSPRTIHKVTRTF